MADGSENWMHAGVAGDQMRDRGWVSRRGSRNVWWSVGAAMGVVLVLVAAGCGHADAVDSRQAIDQVDRDAAPRPTASSRSGEATPWRTEEGEEQPILGELSGLGGRHDETVAGVFVIDSRADWEAMWHAHGRAPEPLPADLDLESRTALVVFLGSRSTGGFSVRIERVLATSDELVVVYRETVPGRGCMVTTAFTYPRHGVVVTKVARPIRFIGEKATRDCEPSP